MDTTTQLRVILFSFGFKYGMPIDVNQLWDVRFLPNPYWVSGTATEKRQRTRGCRIRSGKPGGSSNFWGHLQPLLLFLVKENLAADKHTLRIAIGCTGGRHRSVAVTEKIAALLSGQPIQLTVFHRDIARDE